MSEKTITAAANHTCGNEQECLNYAAKYLSLGFTLIYFKKHKRLLGDDIYWYFSAEKKIEVPEMLEGNIVAPQLQ